MPFLGKQGHPAPCAQGHGDTRLRGGVRWEPEPSRVRGLPPRAIVRATAILPRRTASRHGRRLVVLAEPNAPTFRVTSVAWAPREPPAVSGRRRATGKDSRTSPNVSRSGRRAGGRHRLGAPTSSQARRPARGPAESARGDGVDLPCSVPLRGVTTGASPDGPCNRPPPPGRGALDNAGAPSGRASPEEALSGAGSRVQDGAAREVDRTLVPGARRGHAAAEQASRRHEDKETGRRVRHPSPRARRASDHMKVMSSTFGIILRISL